MTSTHVTNPSLDNVDSYAAPAADSLVAVPSVAHLATPTVSLFADLIDHPSTPSSYFLSAAHSAASLAPALTAASSVLQLDNPSIYKLSVAHAANPSAAALTAAPSIPHEAPASTAAVKVCDSSFILYP